MLKIIHVSDTHVVPAGQSVVGIDPHERLRQVVDAINENHDDAALCVITGDLTDRGDEESYRAFADLVSELKIPYRLLVGNHDNRQNFRRVFTDAPVDADGFVQSTADFDKVRLIFLDSLHDNHAGLGQLCLSRLKWFEAAVKDAARTGRRSVIFIHHPPFSVGVKVFEGMMLENAEPFLSQITANKPLHLAFGHLHLTTSGSWNGIPFSCNRGVAHQIVLNFEGVVTEFIEAVPTFAVMLISENSVLVHHAAPVATSDIIAREYATDDGKGNLVMTR
ncbi:metallophosphoesterase [Sinorhizobium meliloti]|uniref:metallophosphoesterase n=1 Tax=Rhizobium meliloti TaxID=382 RepID=UPI000375CC01|nr:metallophosphoesterase [Sinorhizobium meliloti]